MYAGQNYLRHRICNYRFQDGTRAAFFHPFCAIRAIPAEMVLGRSSAQSFRTSPSRAQEHLRVFLNQSFSTHIVLEQMRHTRNKYSFSSGYTYVFLLSNDEVRKYLSQGADSKVMPTEIEQTKNVFHEWWTRSPGIENCSASLVNEKGAVDNSGLYYDKGSYLLRPAVWITASK